MSMTTSQTGRFSLPSPGLYTNTIQAPHQGGIKFKPELRVRKQEYEGMKVDHFVVEKR